VPRFDSDYGVCICGKRVPRGEMVSVPDAKYGHVMVCQDCAAQLKRRASR